MELKEGMYVRFDWKKQQIPILIGKITEVHYDGDEKYYFYLTDNGLVIGEDNLVKEPSYNIIDLIEVGDYVNGKLIIQEAYDLFINSDFKEEYAEYIKSIVTREQFESMQYRLGD